MTPVRALLHSRSGFLVCIFVVPSAFFPRQSSERKGPQLPNMLIPGHCELPGGFIFSSQTPLCSTGLWGDGLG